MYVKKEQVFLYGGKRKISKNVKIMLDKKGVV